MIRWIAVIAALLLAGCASTRDYYYDDGYYSRDGYAYGDRYYDGAYGGSYHDGGYGHGDYWYSPSYRYPAYVDYPYYYSLFWPLSRWSYDPFWYPGYYYGVTWFPRNYFAFSVGWQHRFGPYWGHLAYSPYRWGWSDWYYDWYPWYRAYPNYAGYYGAPRFGDARNEAERLARLTGAHRSFKQRNAVLVDRGRGLPSGRATGLRTARAEARSAERATSARSLLPSRGAPSARSTSPRAGRSTVPRSAPRASVRDEVLSRSRGAARSRDQSYGQRGERGQPLRSRSRAAIEADYAERTFQRSLPQRGYAMPSRGRDVAPGREAAYQRAYALPQRGAEAPLRSRTPQRALGGYDVGSRAPAVAPSRSFSAPAPRSAPVQRSAPPSRSASSSEGHSSRGRGSSDER